MPTPAKTWTPSSPPSPILPSSQAPPPTPEWTPASDRLARPPARLSRNYWMLPRRGDAGQVHPAGAVLDDDQGIEAPQEHGIHVDEVGSEHAAGLRGQELLPRRAGAPGCGADPGVMQDLPHR